MKEQYAIFNVMTASLALFMTLNFGFSKNYKFSNAEIQDFNKDGIKDIKICYEKPFGKNGTDYYFGQKDESFKSQYEIQERQKDSLKNAYEIELQKLDSIRTSQLEKLTQ
ncbi:hypothetical protein GW932_00235 [archaeon]|nr:hypothetical protein [archaeon]